MTKKKAYPTYSPELLALINPDHDLTSKERQRYSELIEQYLEEVHLHTLNNAKANAAIVQWRRDKARALAAEAEAKFKAKQAQRKAKHTVVVVGG